MPPLLSAAQARKLLNEKGLTVSDFAREHDLNPDVVFKLLDGRLKGRNGQAHNAAVLLGMKKGVINKDKAEA
jgi:gp16 family phage-associated protein